MTATITAFPEHLAGLLGTFTLDGVTYASDAAYLRLTCRGCQARPEVGAWETDVALDEILLAVLDHVQKVHEAPEEVPVPTADEVWRMCANDETYAINWTTPLAPLVAMVHRHSCGTITATPGLVTIPADVVDAMWREVGAKPISRDGYPQPALGRVGLCSFCLLRRRGQNGVPGH